MRINAGRPRGVASKRLLRGISDIPQYFAGWAQNFTLDGSDRVTTWHEDSGDSSFDLTSASGTPPNTSDHQLSGYRGVLSGQEMAISVEQALSPPYEIWFACDSGSLGAHQFIVRSSAVTANLQLRSDGSIRIRVNDGNSDIAPAATISADTLYVIGVMCDASGNFTCEVNGTLIDESQADTDDFDVLQLLDNAAAQSCFLGALFIFDGVLSESHRRVVRTYLDRYRAGSVACIGLSNTFDAVEGAETIGYEKMFHNISGYNSQSLQDWFDNIGTTGTPPWLTFINELTIHPYCNRIWFHVGPSVTDMSESEATMRTWVTDVLAEARSQMNTAGMDGTNAVCYLSPLAFYPDPSVSCPIVSSGAYDRSVDLVEWAIANLANCEQGPILPDITFARADDGDPTSPCHVEENHKPDDGWALRNFFN